MITLTTEAAQQIEEALKLAIRTSYSEHNNIKFEAALATIRAARAQEQAEQEPVAWARTSESGEVLDCISDQYKTTQPCTVDYDEPLYAAPVRTKDLTDEEIERALDAANVPELPDGYKNVDIEIARAVIAADREKNRG